MILDEFIDVAKILKDSVCELAHELTGQEKGPRFRLGVALVTTVLAMGVGVLSNVIATHTQKQPDFAAQMKALDDTERSIKELVAFVETQKQSLTESQSIVEKLKNEEQKLRPVVEADRQIVDAVLQAQAARERSHIWVDRVVYFLLGIASSIVASLIYTSIRRVVARRQGRNGMEAQQGTEGDGPKPAP